VQRLSLPAEAAYALCLLGQIAGWRGEREQARGYLQESLALCRAAGDRAGAANALHKLAQVYGSVGDYAEARRQAQESLDLCRQLGRPDWIGYALDVLGWVTLCLGDYAACTDHYTASLRLFQDSGDRLGTALALGGLGSVAWARGGEGLAQAAAYMTESLKLCRAIGHRHQAASRLWYLGQIAVEQGDYNLGRAYGEEGKALAEEVGSRVFVSYNLCSLGAAEGGLRNTAKAEEHLLAVLRIAGEVQHLPPLLIALIELARLCRSDAPDTARRQLARAALATVIAHPACWQPYRVRAQQLAAELAAGAPGPAALSLEQAAAAWKELAG
jgi:tetratricopeptide (TPR) repeat protein